MGTRRAGLLGSAIPGNRRKVARAAINGRSDLEARAPILLRALERQVLGVPRNAHIIRLALASVVRLTKLHEIGKLKLALQEVSDVLDKRANVVDAKVANAVEVATATIGTDFAASYEVAHAGVVAMGLSAARTATLTAILQTMRDADSTSAIGAATKAATDAAKDGSRAVLNRTTNRLTEKLTKLTDRCNALKDAIAEESKP